MNKITLEYMRESRVLITNSEHPQALFLYLSVCRSENDAIAIKKRDEFDSEVTQRFEGAYINILDDGKFNVCICNEEVEFLSLDNAEKYLFEEFIDPEWNSLI